MSELDKVIERVKRDRPLVANADLDILITTCRNLEASNARHVLYHIKPICPECAHLMGEDGCANCLNKRISSLEQEIIDLNERVKQEEARADGVGNRLAKERAEADCKRIRLQRDQLKQDRDKWKEGCEVNAAALVQECRTSDIRRLELLSVKQDRDNLRSIVEKLNDCLTNCFNRLGVSLSTTERAALRHMIHEAQNKQE